MFEISHSTKISSGSKEFYIDHADNNDHIFNIIRSTGDFYEIELLESVKKFLNAGDLVVDVGANIGNHSLYFAGICGCKILALEPNHNAYQILTHNISRNKLDKLICAKNVAAGIANSLAKFDELENKHNLGASSLTIGDGEVIVKPLDIILDNQSPRFIKIDAEGMELSILKGCKSILQRSKPIICVEAKSRIEFLQVFDFLTSQGYILGEIHNYSPTHVFFPIKWYDLRKIITIISRYIGLERIRVSNNENSIRNRLSRTEENLRTIIAGIDRSHDSLKISVTDDMRLGNELRDPLIEALREIQWEHVISDSGSVNVELIADRILTRSLIDLVRKSRNNV